ncbi:SemiSWEET family sugar transporter [Arenibaculum pallidiluteum]|uniref:SemiSWEET family sugar transporter n=1 Tax=Arenibaculum pallidiluteum TaxID=2812559 RepID=UPI001A9762E6|nr:PQ-loop domain-containing transporter [Arenibaculum pallidiluteum]
MESVVPMLIGLIAGCLSTYSFVPQVVKCWRTGETAAISLRMFAVRTFGLLLWTGYGLAVGSLRPGLQRAQPDPELNHPRAEAPRITCLTSRQFLAPEDHRNQQKACRLHRIRSQSMIPFGQLEIGNGPSVSCGANTNPIVFDRICKAASEESIPCRVRAAP